MSIGINYANTGLITQNQNVISSANHKLIGANETKLKAVTSGTMRGLSEKEIAELREKERNAAKTVKVNSSELTDDYYCNAGDNVTFEVDGVLFSNEEMKACKEIMKYAKSLLPTKGSGLNYNDYASMGIAENMAGSYAEKHLTKEQADVFNRYMKSYLDSYVQAEEDTLQRMGCYRDNTEDGGSHNEINEYYNVKLNLDSFSRESWEEIREMFLRQLGPNSRGGLISAIDRILEKGGTSNVQSASNKELTSVVRSLFRDGDLDDPKAVDNLLKKYKELLTPAYSAWGIKNTRHHNALADELNSDAVHFLERISNAKAVVDNAGNRVDCKV